MNESRAYGLRASSVFFYVVLVKERNRAPLKAGSPTQSSRRSLRPRNPGSGGTSAATGVIACGVGSRTPDEVDKQ